jgi:hypothetical protein
MLVPRFARILKHGGIAYLHLLAQNTVRPIFHDIDTAVDFDVIKILNIDYLKNKFTIILYVVDHNIGILIKRCYPGLENFPRPFGCLVLNQSRSVFPISELRDKLTAYNKVIKDLYVPYETFHKNTVIKFVQKQIKMHGQRPNEHQIAMVSYARTYIMTLWDFLDAVEKDPKKIFFHDLYPSDKIAYG